MSTVTTSILDRPGAGGTASVLPDRPDEAAAEAWLQDVRRAYWTDCP